MSWVVVEIGKVLVLVVLAVGLHQGIRRYGKGYATSVFDATPEVGRMFITLADFAYYLIFAAYVLFNVNFEQPMRFDPQGNPVGYRWTEMVGATQLQESLASIAGICLLIGILHGINVFVLPFVGSVMALRVRLLRGGSSTAG